MQRKITKLWVIVISIGIIGMITVHKAIFPPLRISSSLQRVASFKNALEEKQWRVCADSTTYAQRRTKQNGEGRKVILLGSTIYSNYAMWKAYRMVSEGYVAKYPGEGNDLENLYR